MTSNIVEFDVFDWISSHPRIIPAGIAIATYAILRKVVSGSWCNSTARLDGKTAVVTGANCGIGLETARDLARRGARLVLVCRNVKTGEEAAADIRATTGNRNVVVYQLDLASLESVRKGAAALLEGEEKIDILINNAGIMLAPSDAKTKDGFELQIGVNHLGHFLLTNLLLDRIKDSAPARIINVSSRAYMMGRLDLNDIQTTDGYGGWEIYGRSKLANIMFTQELARRLEGTNVTTYALHPGTVNTHLSRHLNWLLQKLINGLGAVGLLKSPRQGAQTSIYCAVTEGIEPLSGKYFSHCAETTVRNKTAKDPSNARTLWELSARLVGLEETI